MRASSASEQSRNAGEWASRLQWGLDGIALAALAATGEVDSWVFAFVLAVAALRLTLRLHLGERVLFPALMVLIGGALALWLRLGFHPIVAAASSAPIAHALLWLATPWERVRVAAERHHAFRGWRLGFGFIELVVASGLTPEFYLPIAIVLFVILSSVALSCGYLDQELSSARARSATRGNADAGSLPPSYIRRSLYLSFLIFLTAAVIFPLLPRTQSSLQERLALPTQGYTEEVNLSQLTRLSSEQSSQPVVRVFGEAERLVFPLGLLRARVLEHFDGLRWHPVAHTQISAEASQRLRAQVGAGGGDGESSQRLAPLEFVRERLATEALLVPYGATWVEWRSEGLMTPPKRSLAGEWLGFSAFDRRVSYAVWGETQLARMPSEPPGPAHLRVPDVLRTPRWRGLTRALFGAPQPPKSGQDSMRLARTLSAVRAHLSDYRALPPLAPGEAPAAATPMARTPTQSALEEFLFEARAGHCEWFASSAALLLREAGVATRMIAGFRVSQPSTQGVLTVRQGDAHAWLEYWDGREWVAWDPTPRIVAPAAWWNPARELYDWTAAYWFRYVVQFGGVQSALIRDLSTQSSALTHRATTRDRLERARTGALRWLGQQGEILLVGLLICGLGVALGWVILRLWFPRLAARLSLVGRTSEERRAQRELRAMERLLERAHVLVRWPGATPAWSQTSLKVAERYGARAVAPLLEWQSRYEASRFGGASEWARLPALRGQLNRALDAPTTSTGSDRS